MEGVARDLVIEHVHRALGGIEQSAQHADGRRLAGTVRAQEAVDLGARDVEVDVIDGDELAEAAREPASGDRRRVRRFVGTQRRGRTHLPPPIAGVRTSTGTPVGSSFAAGSVSVTSMR